MFKETFDRYLDNTTHRQREYFRTLKKDSTIEIALRLAVDTSKDSNTLNIMYRTLARTSGLSDGRKKTSEDISPNEGIARFLIEEKGCLGVLVYNDIPKAAEHGAFKLTKSEQAYPDDIKTMMVATLNGWDGEKMSMIGIFFVTSRDKNTFSLNDVDSVLFLADMFSRSIVNTMELFGDHKKNVGGTK